MTAKDLLLVGSGLAIGYLIFKKDLFKKKANGLGELTGVTELDMPASASRVWEAIQAAK